MLRESPSCSHSRWAGEEGLTQRQSWAQLASQTLETSGAIPYHLLPPAQCSADAGTHLHPHGFLPALRSEHALDKAHHGPRRRLQCCGFLQGLRLVTLLLSAETPGDTGCIVGGLRCWETCRGFWRLQESVSARASWGCRNKLPETRCLKTREIYSSTRRRRKSRCWQGLAFLSRSRGGVASCPFWLLLAVGCWLSRAKHYLWFHIVASSLCLINGQLSLELEPSG